MSLIDFWIGIITGAIMMLIFMKRENKISESKSFDLTEDLKKLKKQDYYELVRRRALARLQRGKLK